MSGRKLPPTAYVIEEGQEYVPLTAGESLPEFTAKAVLAGIVLGLIFGAANTYLGLKAGLTISTSIPVAVLTVVAFRVFQAFGLRHSILETNLSQTVGSASSSVASGVLFTVPALFIWGLNPEWLQISLLAMCGGLIGVLCMIPLRRFLIKREHGSLPYPEGMACAEVLVASEEGGSQAAGVFWGIGVGMAFKMMTDGLKLVRGVFEVALPARAAVTISVSPPLIGVGYILGVRIAAVMVAGGLLSAMFIIPAIYLWGSGLSQPLYPETHALIRDMSTDDIWNRYVRYIGAGAVATGGVITLLRSIPTMAESFRLGIRQISGRAVSAAGAPDRTDEDMSPRTVLVVLVSLLAVMTFVPGILGYLDSVPVRALASLLIAAFAFFFVTVSSRIVGLVGVTSNPTSGMTIATLLGTSLVFLAFGWTDMAGKATALMVGTAVAIAASIAGDTSQDLKTGFLLGATPRFQQIGELIGVITSAGVVVLVVMLLQQNVPGGLGGPELPAPQATLMALVIDGVLDQNLPWLLIAAGIAIGLAAWALRMPVLAFAVGVYLPLDTMAAVFAGGALRYFLTKRSGPEESERRRERGVLFGSGLVGGGGLTGVVLALWVGLRGGRPLSGFAPPMAPWMEEAVALATIASMLGIMAWFVLRRSSADSGAA